MGLYLVQYDHESYYVEARDFHGAIDAWKRHVAVEWDTDCNGTEEPESVAVIHEGPVIREPEPATDRA